MTKRLSLILGEGDQLTLEPFIRPGTGQHQVLQHWAAEHGVGAVTSEAAAIRALLQAGAEALAEEVLDAGYAELAQVYGGVEERSERRTPAPKPLRERDGAAWAGVSGRSRARCEAVADREQQRA